MLGPSLRFRGELSAQEDLIVQGSVEGSITHTQSLTVGTDGTMKGDIRARVIVIDGKVEGDLYATESVSIRATAKVKGNVFAPRVGITEGAFFQGQIEMQPSGAAVQEHSARLRHAAQRRRRWREPAVDKMLGSELQNRRMARGGQEQLRVDPGPIQIQRPVQMRAGRAAGHADGADARAGGDALPGRHVDGAQMAVHADQAAPVIDEHGIAGEEIISGVDHGAVDRREHRRAGGAAMSMPVCGLRDSTVEHAARAEGAASARRGPAPASAASSGGGSLQWFSASIDATRVLVDSRQIRGRQIDLPRRDLERLAGVALVAHGEFEIAADRRRSRTVTCRGPSGADERNADHRDPGASRPESPARDAHRRRRRARTSPAHVQADDLMPPGTAFSCGKLHARAERAAGRR